MAKQEGGMYGLDYRFDRTKGDKTPTWATRATSSVPIWATSFLGSCTSTGRWSDFGSSLIPQLYTYSVKCEEKSWGEIFKEELVSYTGEQSILYLKIQLPIIYFMWFTMIYHIIWYEIPRTFGSVGSGEASRSERTTLAPERRGGVLCFRSKCLSLLSSFLSLLSSLSWSLLS